jgi:hypothetical protein
VQWPPEQGHLHTPVSEFLHEGCAPFVRKLFHDQESYDQAFDKFEYLNALFAESEEPPAKWVAGRWLWKAAGADTNSQKDIRSVIGAEFGQAGNNWS